MVKIRLARGGRKKKAFYRIVAADSRMKITGRFLETIGFYNPVSNPKEFKIDDERLAHWISEGAELTDTVNSLVKKFAKTAE